jgi:hypothetical protein
MQIIALVPSCKSIPSSLFLVDDISSPRFLVEGPEGAVLHTGDVRADALFLQSLSRNPIVQRYIPHPDSSWPAPSDAPVQTLEAIYVDTAWLLEMRDIPSKVTCCCAGEDI